MSLPSLIELTSHGFYCPPGDFYVDPWRPVEKAVITHCHSDHARPGSKSYLTCEEGKSLLAIRSGSSSPIETLKFGERKRIGDVQVSFFPAGHILGSCQIRIESEGLVWVLSGDYKTAPDSTCTPFVPVRCHTFVSESTFGLPIFQWPNQADVFSQINDWWKLNRADGKTSVLFAYAVGKAQRVLSGLDPSIGDILTHGAVERMNEQYRASGVGLPHTQNALDYHLDPKKTKPMVIAPPSANGSAWLRRFGAISTGFASGWMRIRGTRRRRGVDRGFVLSDHVDWDGLFEAVSETRAERVWVTHGYTQAVVRVLRNQGIEAHEVETDFQGEQDDQQGELA